MAGGTAVGGALGARKPVPSPPDPGTEAAADEDDVMPSAASVTVALRLAPGEMPAEASQPHAAVLDGPPAASADVQGQSGHEGDG